MPDEPVDPARLPASWPLLRTKAQQIKATTAHNHLWKFLRGHCLDQDNIRLADLLPSRLSANATRALQAFFRLWVLPPKPLPPMLGPGPAPAATAASPSGASAGSCPDPTPAAHPYES